MKTIRRLVTVLCALTASSVYSTPTPPTGPQEDIFKHFWNVAETMHRIQSKAFRTVALDELIEAGLKAMVSKVDAHSSFFTPQSYQTTINHASGQFAGVGIHFISKGVDEDALLVVDTVPTGPADRAGIQSGDKILEVDGIKLRGLTSTEVSNKLRGPVNSTVTVKVIRDKKPHDFTITRQTITDRSTTAYYFAEHDVAYVGIHTFSEKTPGLVTDLLKKAYARSCKTLLLDLRKNPGGVYDSAVKTASLFLPQNSLVVTARNKHGEVVRADHTTDTPLHNPKTPLFILTDNFTASCSEILTGCLKHYAHQNKIPAFVIGMPTYGKGSVQEVMPLSYGCALKLTTMLYYLPNDSCLQAVGITPDLTVKPKVIPHTEIRWLEGLYGREASLPNHITREEVRGEPRPAEKQQPTPPEEKKEAMSVAQIEASMQKGIANDSLVHTCLTLSNVYHCAARYSPHEIETHEKALSYLQSQVITDTTPAVSAL